MPYRFDKLYSVQWRDICKDIVDQYYCTELRHKNIRQHYKDRLCKKYGQKWTSWKRTARKHVHFITELYLCMCICIIMADDAGTKVLATKVLATKLPVV